MTIKIEKNVPLPKTSSGSAWPFAEMQTGDSFLVDDYNAREAARTAARNAKVKVATRREGNQFRVWRVE